MYIIVLQISLVTYIIYCCGLYSPQHNPVPPGCKVIHPCVCSRIICMEYIEAINNSVRSSYVYICGCVINVMHGYRHTHVFLYYTFSQLFMGIYGVHVYALMQSAVILCTISFLFLLLLYIKNVAL